MVAIDTPAESRTDVLVIGAGFGGLGAALTLAEAGIRVHLCEAVNYAGGCAATFQRAGHRFEAGATLSSGFAPRQLFRRWIDRHGLDVTIDPLDPVVEFRLPGLVLSVTAARTGLPERLAAIPDAPREGLARFFAEQCRVADILWPLLEEDDRLPPFTPGALMAHAARLPRYLSLLPHAGRPLATLLPRYGLAGFTPLVAYLDGLCQITLQCGVMEAEAPLALAALDYYHRGAGHVRHGLGHLATELTRAIASAGGHVSLADEVRALRPEAEWWHVTTRRGPVRARAVVANLLPHALAPLLQGARLPRSETRKAEAIAGGWGAVMLYRAVRPPRSGGDGAHHLQLVADPAAPFVEGNHLFASISSAADTGRVPDGARTLTASTHIALDRLAGASPEEAASLVSDIQSRMRATFAALAPEWCDTTFERPASPRTFERFTRRPAGAVGGIPRRAGWSNYLDLLRGIEPLPGLFVTGDSHFPGQSTLAAATGGTRAAARVLRRLG